MNADKKNLLKRSLSASIRANQRQMPFVLQAGDKADDTKMRIKWSALADDFRTFSQQTASTPTFASAICP
jgi:hypothetical protein